MFIGDTFPSRNTAAATSALRKPAVSVADSRELRCVFITVCGCVVHGFIDFFFFSYGRVNIQFLGCAFCEWMVLEGGLLWFAWLVLGELN